MSNQESLALKLYQTMYLMRMCEEKIRQHYLEDEMKTPTHLYVGGEAIATGVIAALDPQDQVFGTYRSHGVYLAKTMETDKFFAELFGRATGVARGKAGSMHLSSPEHGLLGTSAVVGTTIPVAVGAAFANQYQKTGKMVAVFFGDGALDEGVFWESLNLACLKKIPLLLVCEDNDLAIHAKTSERQGYKKITEVVSAFNCHTLKNETTTDVEEIYKLTKKAIKLIEHSSKPAFLHLRYYRYYEHVGINYDFQFGYRSEEEFKFWLKKDPLDIQRKKLLKRGYTEENLGKLEAAILKQINKSFEKAKTSAFANETEVLTNIYA